ncbi:MAG: hypothetical protein IT556_17090 [Acetobacteraceae bacterium]|nr:hypothetical protein [Acetobacteraceae bacterium]
MKPVAIGHNGGPPLAEPEMLIDQPDGGWKLHRWRSAHRKAWKTPPPEIALRRLARAEELGISYRDYTLEILERGRFL